MEEPFDKTQDKQEPLDSAQGKQQNEIQEEQNVQMEPTPLPPPPSHKKLIIGVVAGFVLVVGVAGAYFVYLKVSSENFNTENALDTEEACLLDPDTCTETIVSCGTLFVCNYGWQAFFDEDKCGCRKIKTADTRSWKTYQNEEYGFEVKYPQDYFITEEEGEVKFFDTVKQSLANFTISYSPLKQVSGYPDEWLDLDGFFQYTDESYIIRKISDDTWSQAWWGSLLGERDLYQIHGKNFFKISYNFPTRLKEDYKTLFETILSTFKFIE